jgi:hypothetical protein
LGQGRIGQCLQADGRHLRDRQGAFHQIGVRIYLGDTPNILVLSCLFSNDIDDELQKIF